MRKYGAKIKFLQEVFHEVWRQLWCDGFMTKGAYRRALKEAQLQEDGERKIPDVAGIL